MAKDNLEGNLWQESHEEFHHDEIANLKERILNSSETPDIDSLFDQAYTTLGKQVEKNHQVWHEALNMLDERVTHEEAIVSWMKSLFDELKKSEWNKKIIDDRMAALQEKLGTLEQRNETEQHFSKLSRSEQLIRLSDMSPGEETDALVWIVVEQEKKRIYADQEKTIRKWVQAWTIPARLVRNAWISV